MKKILFALTLVLLGASVPAPRSGAVERRPNVLIILTDDQRSRQTMSVMPETARIFGSGGTRFTNAVVTTPLCCPSRGTFLSGRYAHNHGVKSNLDAPTFDQTKTMQAELGEAGYLTAMAGKFFNVWRGDPLYWDRWALLKDYRYNVPTFNMDGTPVTLQQYVTDVIGHKAIEFLDDFEERNDGRPWFMQISPLAPHAPAAPEADYERAPLPRWRKNPAARETDLSDKPDYVRSMIADESVTADFRAKQLRTLMSVDDLVERVFSHLEALREADNTLAFFVSDNGFMWQEHGLRNKRHPYDQSVKIPFFVRWPGHFAAGAEESKVVANVDVAPTVYDAAGVDPDYTVDGKNLATSTRRRILIEYFVDPLADAYFPPWLEMWSPGRSYIRYTDTGEREGYAAGDRWQLSNLYNDGIRGDEFVDDARLDRLLDRWSTCAGSDCP